jgi:hypothetical protein
MTFIGYNENGLIGFFNGTTELLYLERPRNWKELVKKKELPYIKHADVHAVNLKNYREEDDGKKNKIPKTKRKIAKRKV